MKYLLLFFALAFSALSAFGQAYNKVQIVDGSNNPIAYDKVVIVSSTGGAVSIMTVGTTAGTVAAGDDSRIVGAAQTASLGSSAFIASTAYATAAQGIKADSASVISPSSIANMTLWLKAETLTGTEGSLVSSWVDSGTGSVTLTGTTGKLPYLTKDGISGVPSVVFSGTQYLTTASFFDNIDHSSMTGFVVAQTSVVTPDGNYNQLLGATWPNFNLVLPGTDTEVGNAGITVSAFNNTRAGHALSNTSDPVAFGWRLGAASGTLGTWLNERKSVDSDMTTSASSAAGGFWIGNNSVLTSVYYFKGKVSEVILYNRALTDVEVRSVNRYLVEKYRLNQTDLILDGDSITLGTKSTWGHSLQTLLYKQNLGLKIVDIGVGGRGSTGRLATMAKWAPAQRASSEPILYMVGTNDINGTGTSAIPLLESNVMAYGTNAHLYNKRLIISTIPSIKTLSHDEDNAAQIYNAWVRANWKSFADGLCDYGSIPQVGALGANASGTYFYSDGIHPLPAGYDLMAPVATDALRELYGLQISSHLVASGTATAYPTDSTVIVTGTAGATIVLPLATTPRNGKTLTIKDGGGMALVNNIAISGTVNGSAASPIITNYGSITIMTDGTNWFSR